MKYESGKIYPEMSGKKGFSKNGKKLGRPKGSTKSKTKPKASKTGANSHKSDAQDTSKENKSFVFSQKDGSKVDVPGIDPGAFKEFDLNDIEDSENNSLENDSPESSNEGAKMDDRNEDDRDTGSGIEIGAVIPPAINTLILLMSRTGWVENKPISKEEGKILKESFNEAFKDIVASPKMIFFITLLVIISGRVKLK